MSTRSCVIIKVRPEDADKMKKFNKDLLPVREEVWDSPAEDKSKSVKLSSAYLGIYCHWDGYPDGVGAALKENFKTYEQVLNLVVGGACSVIDKEYVKRYAARKGEEWEYLKPVQRDNLEEVTKDFDWSEYAYLFTDEYGWQVNNFDEKGFSDF